MTIVRWQNAPSGRLFWEKFMNEGMPQDKSGDFVPSTNIIENDSAYQLELAVPGFSKKDFHIDLEKNVLKISSEREAGKENEDLYYSRREFRLGNFSRTFIVPDMVNVDDIKAEYKNGILTVTLPKKEEVKVKKEIRIS